MASSVSNQIIQNANLTAQNRANQDTIKESSSSVNSQDFLFLLTQQLQYQDPMNPMDNSQMLAQEAQFATLEQMEALTSSFSQFSNIYQANSLLGQKVEVNVDGKETSGKVDYVDYSDKNGASVSIGGKMYPLDSVTKVYPEDTTTQESDTNFFKTAAASIANNLTNITNALFNYEDGTTPPEGANNQTNTNTETK
ncbi:MAG: hypothetical protein IJB79_07160 [Candidatus Gastranaerophilales bacterium]|nr:hypothetical protein [Candidatus Gastranaerophilales bacterium]